MKNLAVLATISILSASPLFAGLVRVPEPTSLALVGIGLAGLALWKQSRR